MTNVFNAEKTPAQHTDFSRQLGVLARVASPYAVEAGIGAGVGATLGGIGAVPGAAAGVIAGSLLDLGSSVYNYLAHSQGWPQVETFHERLNKLADYYNIPKAETVSENFAKSIEDATLGVGSMGASADKLLLTLAHNPIG